MVLSGFFVLFLSPFLMTNDNFSAKMQRFSKAIKIIILDEMFSIDLAETKLQLFLINKFSFPKGMFYQS